MELLLKKDNFCNGKTFVYCERRNPADLKWNEVDVDVVAECTGFSQQLKLQMSTSKVVLKSNYLSSIC
jgi:glyceraldehyde-3-phosphate dehydrogenase/erythrose-4-phosphate dehydrogenase